MKTDVLRFGARPVRALVSYAAHKRQRQQEKQLEQEVAVKEGARTMDGGPTTLRVRDVDVPVKPTPPGPEECCQSGT